MICDSDMKKIGFFLPRLIINLEEKKRHSPEHNLMVEADKHIKHWLKSIENSVYTQTLSRQPIYEGGGYVGVHWPFITPFH